MQETSSVNSPGASDIYSERVLVLDFGSQYAQLIARRVREQHVYCEIVRHDITAERVAELAPKGIILSGGPSSVYEPDAPKCDPGIFDLDIPVLGICYGMQLMCDRFGGSVRNASAREYGHAHIKITDPTDLLAGLPDETDVWMSHGDQVEQISGLFRPLASTRTCPVAAMRHVDRKQFGIQFHPEVTHTPLGSQILRNFVISICGCEGTWKLGDFARETIARIREEVGTSRVICGLSGGVDSSVVAALLYRAIGDQLSCILVDNGLLRKDEEAAVIAEFSSHFKTDLHVVNARERFLKKLEGISDPQEKRKRIGYEFIECFKEEAAKIEDAKFLAQGTLYPDVIESGAAVDGPAAVIKLHHNVGGLPAELGFDLVEPLRDLFKDEVRKLGIELGLPEDIVWRHPFPGPGLAVRCLGEVTEEKLAVLREADAIVVNEIKSAGLYRQTSQTFAVLLPVQSVGVMGDARTYDNAVCVRCVDTDDFMTATWSDLPYEVLARISTRIINEVKGVNRVCYDISTKPPATIEWE
ncbi:glutamine-hydrolyzing GMP synthase [Blastopirellula marina]|uniref:GMP synthase [glutamine-hydrolyzing] n=1 Tax=Blastopirellula marina TaxID=124 RepID=A0A2S8G9E6_9BACT|nr:glutamine-hydrolyzing GMP synthase [Blastopirellula marina]PQO40891.1 GMP synthase (glutamine-hydrolyzing) [Blastopirellula marina]PTL45773.1 glutamine-hydrolyzing GMP synthase [Blastopirellula marina]